MSYASLTELRAAYLPQAKTDAATDALLSAVLERANAIVNEALGFEFTGYGAVATTRDVLCQHGRSWLELPAHEAGSVTVVSSVDGRGTSDESLTTETDWMEEADGRLYMDGGWGAGVWYRVTALWGYGTPPASLVEVELRIARTLWRNRDAQQAQGSIGVDGDGAVDVRSISWDERNIIENVRRKYLGVVHA